MAEIEMKLLSPVGFESFFKRPVLFKDAGCDEMARTCLEVFSIYGLTPLQLGVSLGDQTFNYDLSFSIFKGNATFRFSAEKLEFSFQNAINQRDVELVADCMAKVFENLTLPEIDKTVVSANFHASFKSKEEEEKYHLQHSDAANQIAWKGTVAYLKLENWAFEIRVLVDKSLAIPGGLFVAWVTSYQEQLTRDALDQIRTVLVDSVKKLDLELLISS